MLSRESFVSNFETSEIAKYVFNKLLLTSKEVLHIHIFDYPDPRLTGLFRLVPMSLENPGSTAVLKKQSFYRSSVNTPFLKSF